MSDEQFRKLCNVFGFAPSRALRELIDCVRAQEIEACAKRKPLTDEEIRDLWSWSMTAEAERTATTQQHAFARAIEAKHGIT